MRICPSCRVEYKNRKKGRCRKCAVGIYHGKHNGKPLTILEEEKVAVDRLIVRLQEFVSDRDGVNVAFDYKESAKERSFLYSLVERARLFLSLQADNLGWTAATFVLDLVEYVLSLRWWREHLNSFLMLANKVQEFAREVYLIRRDEVRSEKSVASTFIDDPSLVEGVYS